jgi:hypothetical protein
VGAESTTILTWSAVVSAVLLLGLGARRARAGGGVPALGRALRSRAAPLAVGAATALFLAWIWGSLREPTFVHDEASYLLQADIYASFRLSAPPPPLPEFFEQYHVLLTPRLAPKYPPGHALLLVPGLWLGRPGLLPVVLYGVAAGLLFALARALAGAWVAVLTWLLWLFAPMVNLWRASYLSQSSSTALWMLGAWLLWRWWEAGRPRDLVGMAVVVAWMGITRPLTAVAFAAPLGALVLARTWRGRALVPLAAAALAGCAVLAILPLWAAASTGDWRTLPYNHYSRVYFPYEKLGFGVDPAAPLRELPADMLPYDRLYRDVHAAYTPRAVPRALLDRLTASLREFWGTPPWRGPLVLFFLAGLPALGRRGWFAVAWALAPFLAYLAYAHQAAWAVYYYESHAVLAFVAALGLWRTLGWLAGGSRQPGAGAEARLELPAAGLAVLVLALGLFDARTTKAVVHRRVAYHRAFAGALAAIPQPRAVVFVRYHPAHNVHRSLIENPPDHASARIWVVRDRGADNRRLIELAPDRAPYLFDEATGALYRLTAGS